MGRPDLVRVGIRGHDDVRYVLFFVSYTSHIGDCGGYGVCLVQPSATSPLFFDNLHFEHFDQSVNISRRQLIPIFLTHKPAFSRFSLSFQPRIVVHNLGKIVKRQVCQKWG
jgi:hypothetical protein